MICLFTEFHMSSSSSSLVIAIKPKAWENFLTAPILFYILQKYYLTRKFQFLLPHIISVPKSKRGLHCKFILMPDAINNGDQLRSMTLEYPPMA